MLRGTYEDASRTAVQLLRMRQNLRGPGEVHVSILRKVLRLRTASSSLLLAPTRRHLQSWE